MNKSTSVLYIAAFLTIIGGFSLASLLMPDRNFSASENRALAARPDSRIDSITSGTFFKEMNQYLNDQIALRDQLVALYQKQQGSKIFDVMLFENLFRANSPQKPEDGTPVEDARILSKLVLINQKWILPLPGKAVYMQNIDAAAHKLNEAVKFAADQGTESYFIFNPSRTKALMHLYPPFLRTDSYDRSKEYFLSKLEKYVNVVDTGKRFDSFTNAEREQLYLETDHHWNIAGAFIAYQEMIAQLSERSPLFEDVPMSLNEIDVGQLTDGRFEGSYNSQINDAVNPDQADRTTIYEPRTPLELTRFEVVNKDGTHPPLDFNEFYGFKRGQSAYTYGSIYGGDRQKIVYENARANNELNVLLLKDSYMNPLTPYLARHFRKLTVLDNRYYSEFSLRNVLANEHYDLLLVAFHDDNLFSGNYEFEKKNGQ
ncbi:DHHW family protein [Cohnella sp.]|uniref:DHHW family protein n=1 Tax=Cohnella sp. TaxID=1883426 RepID=UPI003564221B